MELYFDIDLCTGCGACELACAESHHGERRINLELFEGRFPLAGMCRHCEQSPCVQVCPKKAIRLENSTVLVSENLCIGCRSCSIVCPFGNLEFETLRHVSTKCDHCISRLRAGEKPVCALVCPTGALRYCELEEMEALAARAKRKREMVGARVFAWRPK